MSKVKLYLNEDIHAAVVRPLKYRGFDVVTTDELGKKGQSDLTQLKFAVKQKRIREIADLTYPCKDTLQ